MGNSIKGLTKVEVDNHPSLSLIHEAGHLVIEGDQVDQAGPAFHEPMLAGPDPLVVLHTSGETWTAVCLCGTSVWVPTLLLATAFA